MGRMHATRGELSETGTVAAPPRGTRVGSLYGTRTNWALAAVCLILVRMLSGAIPPSIIEDKSDEPRPPDLERDQTLGLEEKFYKALTIPDGPVPPDEVDSWLKSFVRFTKEGKEKESAVELHKVMAVLDRLESEGKKEQAVALQLAVAKAIGAAGRIREAMDLAREILKLQPRNEGAVEVQARGFLNLGQLAEAERILKAAVKDLNPKNGVFHSLLGQVYYGQYMGSGSRDILLSAASELEQALRYGWPHGENFTRGLLAEVYACLGERAKALESLSRVDRSSIPRRGEEAIRWCKTQINVFDALGDWKRAADLGEQLLRQDMPLSKRVEVWLALASHYNKAGEPRKALEYVGKALAADTPQEFASLAHAVSSNCYRNLGMWEESIREAKICLTVPCRHTTVRQNMCLDMAYCYEQLGKASEAREALQRAVSMDPKSDGGKLAATILANGWPKSSQNGQVSGRKE